MCDVGILLPLTESGASAREAVIFASVLQKKSIPVLQSSAAMLMLTKMEYSGAQMLFLKVSASVAVFGLLIPVDTQQAARLVRSFFLCGHRLGVYANTRR